MKMRKSIKVLPDHLIFKVDFAVAGEARQVQFFVVESISEILEWMESVSCIYLIELVCKEDGVRVIASF